MTAIGIQTLSPAIELLRQDVDRERDRADGRKRIDELQASVVYERRRIGGLYTDLADARTAAMITGCEAAGVAHPAHAATDERHRPWWRRWFG